MNTDERFNAYVEKITKLDPEKTEQVERCMSEMLELGCSPRMVWQYADGVVKHLMEVAP